MNVHCLSFTRENEKSTTNVFANIKINIYSYLIVDTVIYMPLYQELGHIWATGGSRPNPTRRAFSSVPSSEKYPILQVRTR
ncbi:hypothetical protein GJ496_008090 [Pomphorhynchus laevis]|nr:hypothetical protein GJ496_008090 [Pomphorhynchus laevis]